MGFFSIADSVAAVETMQPFALNVPPNGTTIGPDVPAAPLWMCDAVGGLSNPESLVNFQHACSFFGRIVITACPEPFGAPLGTSTAPVSFAR